MKIGICFTGLERSVDKTYTNILSNVVNDDTIVSFLFVTWENESTEKFQKLFPSAYIHRVKEITMENPEFRAWSNDIQMHISWRRTYEPHYALFRYFQQIYLWKQAALFLEQVKSNFDILMRIRTDIQIQGIPTYSCYANILENELYFPCEPRHSIFLNEMGCPDYYFVGKPETVIKALSILDYTHKYKMTYTEKCLRWFGGLKLEENVIQPETTMYLFLQGEGIQAKFVANTIEIIR